MLLTIAYIVTVVFVSFEISDLKRKIDGFYVPYNDMFSKVNGLYRGDKHGTERPKIDIFEDRYEYERLAYFDNHNKIYDRVTELEKKK